MEFTCAKCNKKFERSATASYNQRYRGEKPYCSSDCGKMSRFSSIEVQCKHCNKLVFKKPYELKNSKNVFCSQSCSATYTNIHKTKGTRRSKLEIYLEEQLLKLYPNLDFVFNSKSAIGSELDIYLPSLELAFELKGIFHYEPIYGQDKLNQIQNNDGRKYQACLEHNIELCILDTSQQKYFKEKTSQKYLNIIISVIQTKQAARESNSA